MRALTAHRIAAASSPALSRMVGAPPQLAAAPAAPAAAGNHSTRRPVAAGAAAPDVAAAAPGGDRQPKERPQKAGGFGTDSRDSPFDELKLPIAMKGMGKVRVRQHVNPLRAEYQQPMEPIDWSAAFDDPTLPLVVDLGCGPGRFLLLLQRRAAAGAVGPAVPRGGRCNYLGIEIRRTLVDRANSWARLLGCEGSVHYVFANATVNLSAMLSGYPGPIEAFYAQFPDPHFKRRHRKRRLLQPDTVRAMSDTLVPGGFVFLQSDILRAAEGLRDAVEEAASDKFDLAPQHSDPANTFLAASSGPIAAAATAAAAAAAAAAGGESVSQEAAGGDTSGASGSSWDFTDTAAAAWEGGRGGANGSSREEDEEGEDEAPFVSQWAEAGWLKDNPVGVPTEREYYVAATQGGAVYRVLLVKRQQ